MLGLCWIVMAPMAGLIGSGANLSFAFVVLGLLAIMAAFAAAGNVSMPIKER